MERPANDIAAPLPMPPAMTTEPRLTLNKAKKSTARQNQLAFIVSFIHSPCALSSIALFEPKPAQHAIVGIPGPNSSCRDLLENGT